VTLVLRSEALLASVVTDGTTPGGSLCIVTPKERIDFSFGSDGLGVPVRPSDHVATYCAIKPLLAILAGRLIDQRELSLDDQLDDLLEGETPSQLGRVTVRQLLTHRSGVYEPDALKAFILTSDEARQCALGSPLLTPPLAADETYYTEPAAWLLMADALRSLVDLLDMAEGFLASCDLGPEFTLRSAVAAPRRQAINASLRSKVRPLLIETSPAMSWEANPGYGGRATISGLVRLNHLMLDSLTAPGGVVSVETAREMLAPEPMRFDRRLGRRCSYSAGWLTDLRSHYFGSRLSPRSFGTVGLAGMTAVASDPELQVSVGYQVNALSDPESFVTWLRPAMVSALISDASSSL
jgi:CubicO group peptidase (beta-lactamase class C family)